MIPAIARTDTIRQIPSRTIAIAAVLIVAAATGLVLIAGTMRRPLPAPLGPARNGLLVASISGDIVTVDPANGMKTVIVAGPETDESPVFSGLGTQIVFTRRSSDSASLFLADANGSNVRQLLSGPRARQHLWWDWSADGRRLIYPDYSGTRTLILDPLTGTTTEAHPGADQHFAMWRPGHDEYVFRSSESGSMRYFLASADGPAVREIAFPVGGARYLAMSPDGSELVYVQGENETGPLHLLDIDTGRDRLLTQPGDGYAWSNPRFSPDGTRILAERSLATTADGVQPIYSLVLLPVDGARPAVELGPATDASSDRGGAQMEFSPDGTSVLVNFDGDGSLWMLDTTGGPARQLDWSFTGDRDQFPGFRSYPSAGAWQRLAP